MPKGIIGESGADREMNKICGFIERNERVNARGTEPQKYKDNYIIQQLKELHGKNWERELNEIRREQQDPVYRAAKDKARTAGIQAFRNLSRREQSETGLTESQYAANAVNSWRTDLR